MKQPSNRSFKLILCLIGLVGIACPFKSNRVKTEPIGPTVKADLLIYFNTGLTQEQINIFSDTVLSRPRPDGRGYSLPAGVRTFLRLRSVDGHDGIAVTFFPSATNEQREELMKTIKDSPLVFQVLENMAPDAVKTLKDQQRD